MSGEKLEPGMLLFCPIGREGPRPKVYAVKSCGQSSATLIANHGGIYERATLRSGTVPEGWRLINNAALAADLQSKHTS